MSEDFYWSMSKRSCIIHINGQTHTVDRQHRNWDEIRVALNEPDTTADQLLTLISVRHAIEQVDEVSIRGNQVYLGDEEMKDALADRLIMILGAGFPIERFLKFAENVYANPSDIAKEEFLLFLDGNDLPLTSDGCIIAYKGVREDYMDQYSGTFYNGVGEVISMPREAVDPDRMNLCSTGFHFCSKAYLKSFHYPRTMLVKVNPADIVSIPADYSNTKGRCWRYEVVAEAPRGGYDNAELELPAVYDPNGFDEAEWDWDAEDIDDVLAAIVPVDPDGDTEEGGVKKGPEVETLMHGVITRTKFLDLLATHGTLSGIAKHFNMSAGTIQGWKKKLFPDGIS